MGKGKPQPPHKASVAATSVPRALPSIQDQPESEDVTWCQSAAALTCLLRLCNLDAAILSLLKPDQNDPRLISALQNTHVLIQQLASRQTQTTDKQDVQACSASLLQLLCRLLSVRMRPRDWKQMPYCSSVASVLTALATVKKVESSMHWSAPTTTPDVLSKVAAAMGEVKQLLCTQAASAQQQEQQQQELQQQLENVAHSFLHFCNHSGVLTAFTFVNGSSMQLLAVELAASLAHSLHHKEQPSPAEAGRYLVIFVLMDKLCYLLLQLVKSNARQAGPIWVELCCSPAFMQLALALLLLIHGAALQDGVFKTNSSSSSGGAEGGGGGSPKQQQQQQHQQKELVPKGLEEAVSKLWQAAGFKVEAWQTWLKAAYVARQEGSQLRNTFRTADLQDLAASNKPPSSSSDRSMADMYVIKTLPRGSDPDQQGFVIMTQVVCKCIATHCCDNPECDLFFEETYASCLASLYHSNKLTRQQQQVLQRVVWQLPQFLLQAALWYGGKQPLVTEVAAEAAWCCCTAWQMPGLQQAAAAAAREAAAVAAGDGGTLYVLTAAERPAAAMLPVLLDDWQQLMQQQLLLHMHESSSSSSLTAGLSHASPICSCYATDKKTITSSWDRKGGNCARLYCFGVLLSVLQPLAQVSAAAAAAAAAAASGCIEVWRSKLPAVLLLLEAVMRQALPGPVLCSSSSSSSKAYSSIGAVRLHQQLLHALHELVVMGEVKAGPLKHVLLPLDIGSDDNAKQQQQQQLQQQQCVQQQQQRQQAQYGDLPEQLPSIPAEWKRKLGKDVFQQAQQGMQQMQQQHQLLRQQIFCVAFSHLKLCRCAASGAEPFDSDFQGLLALAGKLAQADANRHLPIDSLAYVRAELAPAVALLAGYVRQAGVALLQQLEALHELAYDGEREDESDRDRLLTKIDGKPTVTARLRKTIRNFVLLMKLVKESQQMLQSLLGEECWHRPVLTLTSSSSSSGGGSDAATVDAHKGISNAVGSSSSNAGSSCNAGSSSNSGSSNSGTDEGGGSKLKGLWRALWGAADSSSSKGSSDTQAVQDQQQQHRLSPPAYGDLSNERALVHCDGSHHVCSKLVMNVITGAKRVRINSPAVRKLIDADSAFADLARELQAVGGLLWSKVPVPWCCNNPDCTNMAGASELQLVGGKGCVCGGCRLARYCSSSCQSAHWQQHRDICAQLAAAAAAKSEQ